MTETKWLTIDESALLCQEMDLSRTKKTIRSWARNGHVLARKQSTATGDMWVLEKAELAAKIKAELEFAAQHKPVQASADGFERIGEPVRTGTNRSEPVRTGANGYKPPKDDASSDAHARDDRESSDRVHSLQTQINALTVDVKWRDQMLDKLTRENEGMLDNMHGQARYIGHLESDLLRLGGEPDEKFLAAPTVKNAAVNDNGDVLITKPHPEQQNLYSG